MDYYYLFRRKICKELGRGGGEEGVRWMNCSGGERRTLEIYLAFEFARC